MSQLLLGMRLRDLLHPSHGEGREQKHAVATGQVLEFSGKRLLAQLRREASVTAVGLHQ